MPPANPTSFSSTFLKNLLATSTVAPTSNNDYIVNLKFDTIEVDASVVDLTFITTNPYSA